MKLDPCLPAEVGDARVTRKFRGSTYDIRIVNRSGDEKGAIRVVMDGVELSGNVLPADREPSKHTVEVTVG